MILQSEMRSSSPVLPLTRLQHTAACKMAEPWRETIDSWLLGTVKRLADIEKPPSLRRRGRPSKGLANEFFRFCVGFMGTGIVQTQERRDPKDPSSKKVSESEASRRLARYIMKSPIVQKLTPEQRRLLNIPDGRLQADIKAFAQRLKKGNV
jgi:hypothetical protein